LSFLEPLFLVGLLAALIPLIVHLINRKKAHRQMFGPMRFLIQSQRRKAPGFKARQFFLMSIRILLLVLLALALAKPFVLSEEGLTLSERLPSANVIVVDNSFSMEHSWSDVEDKTEDVLSSLRTWDHVAIILTNPKTNDEGFSKLSNDQDAAKTFASSISLSKEKGDIAATIEKAAKILESSELPNHRIVVLSDFSKGGFPAHIEPRHAIKDPVETYAFRPRNEENLALVEVRYEQEGDARDNLWLIRATLKNYGQDIQREKIELSIGGEVVAGAQISIPAQGVATHIFRHVIEEKSLVKGEVNIVGKDQIGFDNRAHFVIHMRKKIEVLVVNGEPNSIPYRDETFFLERALNPMGLSESNIGISVTTREGLETKSLEDFDVLTLANVSRISPSTSKRILSFVKKGGGLLITMGDQVDPLAYNQHLAELLPKPLRALKRLALRGDPDAPVKITHMASMKTSHPIFRVFELPGGTTIRDTSVYSYMLLEPSPPERSQTLMTYKDNAPALLERRVERGIVVMLTTSVDDEWTDLPFRTSFLPLMRRSIQHLARRANSFSKKANYVGDEIEIEVASMVKERLIVETPIGNRIVLKALEGKVSFVAQEVGVYEFYADDEEDEKNRLDALSFAANFDPEESSLKAIDEKLLGRWIDSRNTKSKRGEVVSSERRVNLWPWLLFGVTMLLLLETMVSTRQSVLRRLWGRLRTSPES